MPASIHHDRRGWSHEHQLHWAMASLDVNASFESPPHCREAFHHYHCARPLRQLLKPSRLQSPVKAACCTRHARCLDRWLTHRTSPQCRGALTRRWRPAARRRRTAESRRCRSSPGCPRGAAVCWCGPWSCRSRQPHTAVFHHRRHRRRGALAAPAPSPRSFRSRRRPPRRKRSNHSGRGTKPSSDGIALAPGGRPSRPRRRKALRGRGGFLPQCRGRAAVPGHLLLRQRAGLLQPLPCQVPATVLRRLADSTSPSQAPLIAAGVHSRPVGLPGPRGSGQGRQRRVVTNPLLQRRDGLGRRGSGHGQRRRGATSPLLQTWYGLGHRGPGQGQRRRGAMNPLLQTWYGLGLRGPGEVQQYRGVMNLVPQEWDEPRARALRARSRRARGPRQPCAARATPGRSPRRPGGRRCPAS
mmetsp:Transcript_100593/g.285050  ORF Transcript_100593/g.285050 Transcript_100593/m.285050 type:complete len:413 (+) Transcript_100593:840-2078(+)